MLARTPHPSRRVPSFCRLHRARALPPRARARAGVPSTRRRARRRAANSAPRGHARNAGRRRGSPRGHHRPAPASDGRAAHHVRGPRARLPRPHRGLRPAWPATQRDDPARSRCPRPRPCPRRGAARRAGPRPAARDPHHPQGQLRHARPADERRLARARPPSSAGGRLRRAPAARGGRGDPRQGQHARACGRDHDDQLPGRADVQSVRPATHRRRFEWRHRGRDRGQLRRGGVGLGYLRLHPHPGRVREPRGAAPYGRPREPRGSAAPLAHPGRSWPARPHRRRPRHRARCDRRHGPRRLVHPRVRAARGAAVRGGAPREHSSRRAHWHPHQLLHRRRRRDPRHGARHHPPHACRWCGHHLGHHRGLRQPAGRHQRDQLRAPGRPARVPGAHAWRRGSLAQGARRHGARAHRAGGALPAGGLPRHARQPGVSPRARTPRCDACAHDCAPRQPTARRARLPHRAAPARDRRRAAAGQHLQPERTDGAPGATTPCGLHRRWAPGWDRAPGAPVRGCAARRTRPCTRAAGLAARGAVLDTTARERARTRRAPIHRHGAHLIDHGARALRLRAPHERGAFRRRRHRRRCTPGDGGGGSAPRCAGNGTRDPSAVGAGDHLRVGLPRPRGRRPGGAA